MKITGSEDSPHTKASFNSFTVIIQSGNITLVPNGLQPVAFFSISLLDVISRFH